MYSFTPWTWRDPALLNGGYAELDPGTGPADGGIGSIDEASYEVDASYLVVDESRTVYVDRTKDQIKDSPEYDADTFGKPDYRERVGAYYQESYRDQPPAM